MPEFVCLAACEKVIAADNGTISLISLLDGFHAPRYVSETPLPQEIYLVPLSWAIVSLWRRLPEDEGREYVQRAELLMPDGKVAMTGEVKFTLERHIARCLVSHFGFPASQEGLYYVKLSLRDAAGAEDWRETARYPINVVFPPAPSES